MWIYSVQHVFGKLKGLLIAAAEHFLEYAEAGGNLVWTAGTSQFGIGRQRRHHVARHVHFGYDRDEAFGRIAHNLLGLFLRVEPADGHAVILPRAGGGDSLLAVGTYFGQLGIFLDFDAPALVLGQVPVEVVDVVQGQHVDDFLQIADGEVVAAYVHHKATVAEAWIVLHRAGGQGGQCFTSRDGQGFVEGLYAIEHGSFCCTFQGNAVFFHLYLITFFVGYVFVQRQLDLVLAGRSGDFQFQTAHFLNIRG